MKFFTLSSILLYIGVLFCVNGCSVVPHERTGRTINPVQFGLKEAKTGEDRYYVLLRTHEEAQRLGVGVSYSGIKEIKIIIPKNAKSLPVGHYTDFAGARIVVENKHKNMFLFTLTTDIVPVGVRGSEIDSQSFYSNNTLKSRCKLLVITDKTPWVEERVGYDYGAIRKDIMLVKNGKADNSPVQSYSTPASTPDCYYRDVDFASKIVFKNITLKRSAASTKMTQLVKVENQYNVELSNVTIQTPDGSGLYGERTIYLVNCFDVTMTDIVIEGTYSLPNKFGYGISLNNVYNFNVDKMYARTNWGVFGNSNVNKVHLKNCNINRFDIHCYGRDFYFEGCTFENLYNQFSSVYGDVVFTDCTFSRCTPVLIEASYNAFTAFDLYFKNCAFVLNNKNNCIVDFSGFHKEDNPRPELKQKCLPNVIMSDCRVRFEEGLNEWCIFNTKRAKNYKGQFSHIYKVVIERLLTDNKMERMSVFSNDIKTKKTLSITNTRLKQ